MKTSEQTNELDEALSKFQGKMPVVKKDVAVSMKGTSKSGKDFNVNYEYAPLESIQFIANPILSEFGLNITQDIGFEFSPSGSMIHLVYSRVAHKSGQYKISKWPLDMSGVTKEQDRGSKITFNKRYAYVAALNIALSDEDNDAVGVGVGSAKEKVNVAAAKDGFKSEQTKDSVDFNAYIIQLGPNNKLTGTKLSDHTDNFLKTTVEKNAEYYKEINKKPHPNTVTFEKMVTAYLASLPKVDESDSMNF